MDHTIDEITASTTKSVGHAVRLLNVNITTTGLGGLTVVTAIMEDARDERD